MRGKGHVYGKSESIPRVHVSSPIDMSTHNIFYPLQIVSWLMSNSLNAKCKYTHVLTKRELSASPFMQTAVCYIVLIKITLNTESYKFLNICGPIVIPLCASITTRCHLLLQKSIIQTGKRGE